MTPPMNGLTDGDLTRFELCGIPPELITQAKIQRVDSNKGAEIVGRRDSGDYAGLVFPYIWPGEPGPREYRLRRDHPDIEYKEDGRPHERNKYLMAPGRGNLLYFPPGVAEQWLTDIELPIVITEGEKKTLALWVCAWEGLGDIAEVPRFLPIGLGGVWSWRGTVGKTNGPDGDRRNVHGAIADLHRIAWKGRKVSILYDTNVADNESVQAARNGLTVELQKAGGILSWFSWPEGVPKQVNGIDDLVGQWGADVVRPLIMERMRPVKPSVPEVRSSTREFKVISDDHYRLIIPHLGITLDIDHLRREHHELYGELCVRCELPGANTVGGNILSMGGFNVSSTRAGSERANVLAKACNLKDLDWGPIIEDLRVRVMQAERQGDPGVWLHTARPADPENSTIEVQGFVLPRRHPSILFGDGGTVKSYLALYVAGTLVHQGVSVAVFDWELDIQDHRERLERLFGSLMPTRILYVRCERPLVYEADRLRRVVQEHQIDYSIYDSVAYACDEAPETAEAASRYFRAVRQIGGASLHIAHMTKGEGGDQKPFGSVFWWNSARSIWYAQRAQETPDGSVVELGLYHRKANVGALHKPVGFRVTFLEDRTEFKRSSIFESPELAKKLSIHERMRHLLRSGAMRPDVIAEELQANVESIQREIRRRKDRYVVLEGNLVALRAVGT